MEITWKNCPQSSKLGKRLKMSQSTKNSVNTGNFIGIERRQFPGGRSPGCFHFLENAQAKRTHANGFLA